MDIGLKIRGPVLVGDLGWSVLKVRCQRSRCHPGITQTKRLRLHIEAILIQESRRGAVALLNIPRTLQQIAADSKQSNLPCRTLVGCRRRLGGFLGVDLELERVPGTAFERLEIMH